MAEAKGKGDFHHVVLATFKEEITSDQINEFIKGYANLVNLIPSMKAFYWSRDFSTENQNQGFTHIFDATFESKEGIQEYVDHPAHIEFGNVIGPAFQNVLVVAYKPSPVNF